MSNYTLTQNTQFYKQAVQATDLIESPAVGFVKPSDHRGGTSGTTALIKQNNTQIQLLVQALEEIRNLEAEVKILKDQIQKQKGVQLPSEITDELSARLAKLSIEPSKQKEKKGVLRVFKDPFVILQEEKQKLK